MVRWYYSSIFDEIEDMRKQMESLMREMYSTNPAALLPGPSTPETALLPAGRSGLRVDVEDRDKEVVVTADLVPGVTKNDISISLAGPQLLEISCERKGETEEKKEGYYLKERHFGSVSRTVPLPRTVTREGAKAVLKNGVLEVHLKKSAHEKEGKIPIE